MYMYKPRLPVCDLPILLLHVLSSIISCPLHCTLYKWYGNKPEPLINLILCVHLIGLRFILFDTTFLVQHLYDKE